MVGEGELTAAELLERCLAGASLQGLPGTAQLVNDELQVIPRAQIEDLALLPFPIWPGCWTGILKRHGLAALPGLSRACEFCHTVWEIARCGAIPR